MRDFEANRLSPFPSPRDYPLTLDIIDHQDIMGGARLATNNKMTYAQFRVSRDGSESANGGSSQHGISCTAI